MIEILSFRKEHQREGLDLILENQRDEFGFNIRAEDQPDLSGIETFIKVVREASGLQSPKAV